MTIKDGTGKPAPNPARTAAFQMVVADLGFDEEALQRFARKCRNQCWIGDHLGSHDAQTAASRAFRAVSDHLYKGRGRPRFKRIGEMASIEGSTEASSASAARAMERPQRVGDRTLLLQREEVQAKDNANHRFYVCWYRFRDDRGSTR